MRPVPYAGLLLVFLVMPNAVGLAQVVNGGFEECQPATASPPAAWTLRGGLLPSSWLFNGQYGGPVEIVAEAHTGQRALALGKTGPFAHLYQSPVAVAPGAMLQLSAWARDGEVELTLYEYAGDNWLRTVPTVARITAQDDWAQGGGFYRVTDPQVTHVALVIAKVTPGGVLVDDVDMQPMVPASSAGGEVLIENQGCRLTLGSDGSFRSLFDKTAGEERGVAVGAPIASATVGNWQLPVTRLVRHDGLLELTFGDDQARATVEVQEHPYHVGLLLKSWEPREMASITLLDLAVKRLAVVGGSAGVTYDSKAALGMQTLHYAGSQTVSGTAETVLFRCTFPGTRGLEKAGCALLACPRPRLEQTIQEVEQTYGLPSPRIDGAWGKQSPFVKRSYFFVHDLSEANVDEVIAWGKRGRFAYIQILEDAWSHGGGSFAINETNFPHGIDGLKATVAKLHAAGFRVGLHFLAAGMRGTDPLVSPVPDDGLFYAAELPLAAAIDEKADFIPTTTPPGEFPAEDGGYMGSGTYLRLGDEIIWYRTTSLDPPYGFVDCQRGVLNSTPTAHAAGDRIRHMKRSYGLFLIDADSPLLDRVATRVAEVFNYCNCDGMYFDGSEALQGDHEYYNARIQMAYAEKAGNPNLICQGSSFSPYTWHLVSRCASADGYRDIKGYLDQRSPAFISWYDANLMPIDIGWYGLNPYIRPDDMEYICSRAVGFDASISLSTSIANLKTVPQAGEIVDNLARWEELRLSGKVPDSVRERLREPGKEYHLETRPQESLLIPVEYSQWLTIGEAEGPTSLEVRNGRIRPAKLELQLECGEAIRPGEDYATAQPLELFEAEPPGDSQVLDTHLYNPTIHGSRATSQGVTQEVELVTDEVKEGQAACRFRATSTLKSNSGWATFGRSFDPPLTLSNYAAIGLWVKGDGKGELLKVQLWDTQGNPQDQYITIDFTGWRFIELDRPDPAPVDYTAISRLNFYYNGMPAETTSETIIDGVKVVARKTRLTDPVLRIGGEELSLPVTMSPGDRLVCRGPGDTWLYRVGQEREAVKIEGTLPAVEDTLTVSAQETTHQLLLRAALSWPDLALRIPRS
ncbi:MAG: hypothetical protein HPY69_19490 [Armatimonadetes bacterium]|nr:hypothetical protein [Armatimonadota bacterium]